MRAIDGGDDASLYGAELPINGFVIHPVKGPILGRLVWVGWKDIMPFIVGIVYLKIAYPHCVYER